MIPVENYYLEVARALGIYYGADGHADVAGPIEDVLATIRDNQATMNRYHDLLCNLLARIHRDGGHYTAKVGLYQSVADADQKVAILHYLVDAAQEREQPRTPEVF